MANVYAHRRTEAMADMHPYTFRELRGGSCFHGNAYYVRAPNRNRDAPTNRIDNAGFRCARTP